MNTMSTVVETREPLLTRADRCDATCPAAAMVRVTTATLGTFHFCGHHFDIAKNNLPGIRSIHDERNPLTINPTPSPEGEQV